MKTLFLSLLLFISVNAQSELLTLFIDTTPPSVPTGLDATGGTLKIDLTWTDPVNTDLDSIRIYSSPDNVTFTYLSRVYKGVEAYSHTSLVEGQIVYYKILAVDSDNNQSAFTGVAYDTTEITTTIWYVDRDATGNDNGTSWANACTSLVQAFTKAIDAGDSVYISGGADSTTYNYVRLSYEYPAQVVVVAKGLDTGHTGEVYFTPTGWEDDFPPSSTKRAFDVNYCNNLEFVNLNVVNLADDTCGYLAVIGYSKNIAFDNVDITSNGLGCGLVLGTDTMVTIKNSHIEILANNYTIAQDGINVVNGGGGHTIENNSIVLAGTNATPHKDCIQIYGNEGGNLNYEFTIANNLLLYNSPTALTTPYGLYISYVGSNRFLIYNNVISLNTVKMDAMRLGQSVDPTYDVSMRVFNNTIINQSDTCFGVWIGEIDTLIFKNNIVTDYTLGSQSLLNVTPALNTISYIDIDYNRYYNRLNALAFDGNTFAAWKSLGYDTNSDSGKVYFVNGTSANLTGYKPLNIYNTGTDLSAYFDDDVNNITRPLLTTWDKGAVEVDTSVATLTPTLWLPNDTLEIIKDANNKITQWTDISGNGYNATQADTSLSPKDSLGFIYFDGVDSKLLYSGNVLGAAGTSIHTIEAKLKITAYNGVLLGAAATANNYALLSQTTPRLVYGIGGATAIWNVAFLNSTIHFVIVRNGTTITLYMNGVSQGDKTLGNNNLFHSNLIGSTSAGSPLKGNLYFLRIYNNKVLTPQEVMKLYNDGF